jgi:hypothetical protein
MRSRHPASGGPAPAPPGPCFSLMRVGARRDAFSVSNERRFLESGKSLSRPGRDYLILICEHGSSARPEGPSELESPRLRGIANLQVLQTAAAPVLRLSGFAGWLLSLDGLVEVGLIHLRRQAVFAARPPSDHAQSEAAYSTPLESPSGEKSRERTTEPATTGPKDRRQTTD